MAMNMLDIGSFLRSRRFLPRRSDRRIPVISELNLRGATGDFRLPSDPAYVVRHNRKSALGLSEKLYSDVTLTGYDAEAALFVEGTHREVSLVIETGGNPGATGVSVTGRWRHQSGRLWQDFIGSLPQPIASEIVREHSNRPMGVTVCLMCRPDAPGGISVAVDIWGAKGDGALRLDQAVLEEIPIHKKTVAAGSQTWSIAVIAAWSEEPRSNYRVLKLRLLSRTTRSVTLRVTSENLFVHHRRGEVAWIVRHLSACLEHPDEVEGDLECDLG